MIVRTRFQPTQELEVTEQEAKVLEHQGLLFAGTDEELAEHYRAAGLDLPPTVKPAVAQASAAGKSTTSDQAKGA